MAVTLYTYMQDVQRLLFDMKQEVVNPANIINFINKARSQIASEGACLRVNSTFTTVNGTQTYTFASITTGVAGVSGVLNIRMVNVTVAGVRTFVDAWPYEWFNRYFLCSPSPQTGTPNSWSQYGQGTSGSLFLYPIPAGTYTVTCDTVCYPSDLAADTDTEAIPYPWTDAVPFYAAAYCYLSVQKVDQAVNMWQRFEELVNRARAFSTPNVLPMQYSQIPRPIPMHPLLAGAQQAPMGPEAAYTPTGLGLGAGGGPR